MENNQMIRFAMNKISIEQFAILTDSIPNSKSGIKFETNLVFKADITNRLIACESKFLFNEEGKPFMKLDIQCNFTVEQDDWNALIQKDKSIVIPKGFLCHLAVHTIGTARGILHIKTESTPFNIYIIPTINVDKMINDDYKVVAE